MTPNLKAIKERVDKLPPELWHCDLDGPFTLGGDYVEVVALTENGLVERQICSCPLDTDEHPDGKGWKEDAAIADFIAHSRADISALVQHVEKLKKYAAHQTFCETYDNEENECTCGLTDLLREG